MASRDTDISTGMTSRDSGTPAVEMPFHSMTLEEEALAGGWTRITRPVGGEPLPTFTAGTRGDPDLDSDNTLVPGRPASTVTDPR